ncbi:two component, sigma54 specific, transcriptional regulator, Fis family [Desulfonatronum thiosulfatophilum]|uniref:Two component, sigma54 specific, transcriptional regulator, Fis family n=1 Tax=Desulfonatronum thiosulfatophilum TaxID=617002 RepID=A0A1G6BXT9_9BACT|nr:sigma-54 dependent transcriptional regulator [Desulfonatronum thiosulfatophilum]SDB25400.1 two component, sigma54 specific, transcriptional regulator, Fis family [Desulfonatronum thiosulfatophilum]
MDEQTSKHPVYIVDDDKALTRSFYLTLKSFGYRDVKTFDNGRQVLDLLPELEHGVLLLDLFMPDVSGEVILQQARDTNPGIQVVVVTGVDETDTAVRCIKSGAFDYLVKPVDADRLITTLRRAMSHALILQQNQRLSRKLLTGGLDRPDIFQDIITRNPKMTAIFSYLEVVATMSDPVLITGETGTGKDLLAQAVHRASGRTGAFISLNAAGLDDNVFADTLFGHVKGAFTDAREPRKGLIEQAENGTLFLDEIGDLSPSAQVKLLKLIQDHVYYSLGSDIPKASKARVIAATNRDLESSRKLGQFREDLFYRINTYRLHLPPLRERGEDVLLLVEHYLAEACIELRLAREHVSPRLADLLQTYNFPGNVRELRSLIYAAMAGGGMSVLEEKLAGLAGIALESCTNSVALPRPGIDDWQYPNPLPSLEQACSRLVDQALRTANGNQAKAAAMLGISRQALNKRIRKIASSR